MFKKIIGFTLVIVLCVICFNTFLGVNNNSNIDSNGFDIDAEKFNPNENTEQLSDFVMTEEIQNEINSVLVGGRIAK